MVAAVNVQRECVGLKVYLHDAEKVFLMAIFQVNLG